MSIVSTSERFATFPVEVAISCSDCVCASLLAGQRPARAKSEPSRLPDLVQPWARVSKRLLEDLKAIGLAAEASVSERLAPRLGMKVKAPTLLRYLRTIPAPSDTPVRVLGLDDFGATRTVACVAVRTHERRILPGILLPSALLG